MSPGRSGWGICGLCLLWVLSTLSGVIPPLARATDTTAQEADSGARKTDFWSRFKKVQVGPASLDFGGQARVRYEFQDGFTLKGYEPGGHDNLLLERVRLNFDLRLPEGRPRLFVQLQDAHAFLTKYNDDDFPKSNPIEDLLDVRQAYLEWLRIVGSPVGLRVGRQQISYGDQRIFGPGNWGNTGRYAWEAAMVKVETEQVAADFWVGRYLQYKSAFWPDRALEDFLTFVGYAQVRKLPFRFDLFYALKDDSRGTAKGEFRTGNLFMHTAGFQAEGVFLKLWNAGVTFVGQFGRQAGDTVRAFGANAKIGAKPPLLWSPELTAQYTWGSGDHDPTDGVHGTFDGVFGGRDIFFYGYLNLFFWANLRDAEIDLTVRPHQYLAAYLAFHHFELDQARDAWYTTSLRAYRRDPNGLSGRQLGQELDFRLVWTVWNHLEFMGGYGRFFPGSFVRRTGPASPANWFFFQTLYSW